MASDVPADVRKYVRSLYARANNEVSQTIADQPNMHEETLDHMLITSVSKFGPTLLVQSGAALSVETHWLGGRRHFEGRWEIADIALVAVLRRAGRLVWRKVALLQSKRLYSKEVPVEELDEFDYQVGIGRLIHTEDQAVPLFTPRTFSFTKRSQYGQLRAGAAQVSRIDAYIAERQIPVFYSLYNPPIVPFTETIPRVPGGRGKEKTLVGCRVLRAAEVHSSLAKLEDHAAATFKSLAISKIHRKGDEFSSHGWRLEHFVADEFLSCREGRRFEEAQDPDLNYLLYRRSAPIQSAIVMTIDLPNAK